MMMMMMMMMKMKMTTTPSAAGVMTAFLTRCMLEHACPSGALSRAGS